MLALLAVAPYWELIYYDLQIHFRVTVFHYSPSCMTYALQAYLNIAVLKHIIPDDALLQVMQITLYVDLSPSSVTAPTICHLQLLPVTHGFFPAP